MAYRDSLSAEETVVKKSVNPGSGEEGFILVVTMFILVVLSIIGLSATSTTRVELQIAGNDRLHKETFYQADGGTELGLRLVYDNAICSRTSGGFKENYNGGSDTLIGESVVVTDKTFAENTAATVTNFDPTDSNRHLVYYPDVDLGAASASLFTTYDNQPHTDLLVRGRTKTAIGSGLQMVSGYDGLGASSIGGGTAKVYTIGAKHLGNRNSESMVTIQWQVSNAVLNSAANADCLYK